MQRPRQRCDLVLAAAQASRELHPSCKRNLRSQFSFLLLSLRVRGFTEPRSSIQQVNDTLGSVEKEVTAVCHQRTIWPACGRLPTCSIARRRQRKAIEQTDHKTTQTQAREDSHRSSSLLVVFLVANTPHSTQSPITT